MVGIRDIGRLQSAAMISAPRQSRSARAARSASGPSVARARVAAGAVAAWCVGSALLLAPAAAAAPDADPYVPPSETVAAPVTDTCAQREKPPPAVDTSEDVPPGVAPPAPVPVPAQPVGGGRLGECGLIVPEGSPPLPPDITAGAWVVADMTTGQVLAAKDPHGRYRPASTLKLLTAQVMLRNLPDLELVVAGTENDAGQEGTRVGIEAGGQYTVRQLITYLVIISGNDAANALARTNGGYDKTVADMNAAAQAMGALDTRAVTPSGLDGPGQSTSAYDLALFARGAMATPTFPEIVSSVDVRVPAAAGDGYIAANDNQLLYQYPGALGGKTGFTDDAGNTYVGMAERDGRRLVVTMMNGTQQPRRQWMQAASLLDWGFALPPGTPPVGRMVSSLAEATAAPPVATPSTGPPPAPAPGSASASASDAAGGTDDVITVTSTVQDGSPSTQATSANVAAAGSSGSVPTGALVAGIAVLAAAVAAAVLLIVRRRRQPAFAGDARPAADGTAVAPAGAGSTDSTGIPATPTPPDDRDADGPPAGEGGLHPAPGEPAVPAESATDAQESATAPGTPPAEATPSGESPSTGVGAGGDVVGGSGSSDSGSGDAGSGDSGSGGSGGGDSGGGGGATS